MNSLYVRIDILLEHICSPRNMSIRVSTPLKYNILANPSCGTVNFISVNAVKHGEWREQDQFGILQK